MKYSTANSFIMNPGTLLAVRSPHFLTNKFSERSREMYEITPARVTLGRMVDNDAAERAIDFDLSTPAGTRTDNRAGWINLEFDKTHFIEKIIVYYTFYTEWFNPSFFCAQSEDKFRSCVDNDNNVDVSVYQGDVKLKSCGTLQLTYGLEQSDQIYTLICKTKGDIVKLSKNTGVISVCEVVVVTNYSKCNLS